MRQFSQNEISYEREFDYHVLETSVFGAFFAAVQSRKEAAGLTQSVLAERSGKDKTAISKLLAAPSNLTLRTISSLCVALDLEFEFRLKDLNSPARCFTARGEEHCYSTAPYFNSLVTSAPRMGSKRLPTGYLRLASAAENSAIKRSDITGRTSENVLVAR